MGGGGMGMRGGQGMQGGQQQQQQQQPPKEPKPPLRESFVQGALEFLAKEEVVKQISGPLFHALRDPGWKTHRPYLKKPSEHSAPSVAIPTEAC